MFNSMKAKIRMLILVFAVITTIVTQLVISYAEYGEMKIYLNAPIVVSIGVLVILGLIISHSIVDNFMSPLKKMEKGMKNFIDGKTPDTKHMASQLKDNELYSICHTYEDMMKFISKRNFDLNSQESKTEIILERMEDGVIAFSMQKAVIHMNTAAKKCAGFIESDNTYEKVCRRLGIRMEFNKMLYTANYKTVEEKVTLNDTVLNVSLVPFHNEKLMPMGLIMIIKNITESEKLDSMRKEFVANVSHELKTPLCSIKGYSETILDRELSKEEISRFASVINSEANRLDRIVADLLQLSKFDYNKNVMNKVKFNLDDLVKLVVDNMQYVAKEKEHNLKCIVNMVPPPIFADKDSIQQVIINILSNSIKYTPEGGEITVYIGAAGGKAYIKFVDNGIGIPEKDLKRIFERFYRVDKARSRSMGGTGLGLSIVKEIIESHEGSIDIKSEVGMGTEVVVTLPTIK